MNELPASVFRRVSCNSWIAFMRAKKRSTNYTKLTKQTDRPFHTSIACTSDGPHVALQFRNQQPREVFLLLPVLHRSALAKSSIHPGNAGNGSRCSFGLSVAFAKVKPRVGPRDRHFDLTFSGSRRATGRVVTHAVLLA